mgnify:CR=1 FL=1
MLGGRKQRGEESIRTRSPRSAPAVDQSALQHTKAFMLELAEPCW